MKQWNYRNGNEYVIEKWSAWNNIWNWKMKKTMANPSNVVYILKNPIALLETSNSRNNYDVMTRNRYEEIKIGTTARNCNITSKKRIRENPRN